MRNLVRWGALAIITFLLVPGLLPAPGKSQSTAPGEKAAKKAKKKSAAEKSPEKTSPHTDVVTSIPFGETNDGRPFNASGVVSIGDGQFLFCYNKNRSELLELRLDEQGKKVGAVIRRPLSGVDPAAIKDLEGMTIVERNGDRFVVATSSFNRLQSSKGKQMNPLEEYAGGLLRIRAGTDKTLVA